MRIRPASWGRFSLRRQPGSSSDRAHLPRYEQAGRRPLITSRALRMQTPRKNGLRKTILKAWSLSTRFSRQHEPAPPYDRYASRAWATKMPALRTKRVAATTSKNMGQPIGTNTGLNTMPSKKPASAAQSKKIETGALILLPLMIPGNGSRERRRHFCSSYRCHLGRVHYLSRPSTFHSGRRQPATTSW